MVLEDFAEADPLMAGEAAAKDFISVGKGNGFSGDEEGGNGAVS
jgi:hypothetical protein